MTFKLVSQRWPLQHEARRRGRRGRRGWIPPSRQQSAARFSNYQRNHFGPEVVLRKTKLPMVGLGIHVTGYYEVPPWVNLFLLRRLPGSSEIGKGILLVLSMILARKQCMDEYNICFSEKKTSYN